MAETLSSLMRPDRGASLSTLDRFAPPPPAGLVVAEIEARSNPGDVVIDLHGRGGWIARGAIGHLRRAYVHESTALTRLAAEVVLRPPDLRHFDAAVNALANHPRGDVGLRQALNDLFASRCATCGRAVVVDEFIWDGDATSPARKIYRCLACRDGGGTADGHSVPADDADAERARLVTPADPARAALRERLPVRAGGEGLPEEIVALWTPRSAVVIEAILTRIEADLRAAPIEAALRLALLHVLLPASRLNSYPGRLAALRIVAGHVRPPGDRQWRERNPWLLFEDGCRLVRGFIQRLEAAPSGPVSARFGSDPAALIDGSVNVVMRRGSAERPEARWFGPSERGLPAVVPLPKLDRGRSRVRLVLTQPPIRWTTESLSFAYLTSAVVLGRDAAAALPLEPLFGAPPRADWGAQAAALRRSLSAVEGILAPDARVVIMLDPGGPEGLVSCALGGVEAGYRLTGAFLAETGDAVGGTLEFVPPGAPVPGGPRTRANVSLETPSESDEPTAFRLADMERAITEVAVEVLEARGEPARFERLLGEILVGLDRRGDLRRLVGTRTFAESEARGERALDARGLLGDDPSEDRAAPDPPTPAAPTDSPENRRGSDHVTLLIELIAGELRRPDNGRLIELEPGQWWLREARDIAASALPLADRVEWAVFSLLSTSGGLSEAAFFDRMGTMFRGHDTPDEALVRACLESYRSRASTPEALRTHDDLQARYAEHAELTGLLVGYGHRLGLRCWVGKQEQKRSFRGAPLADLLTDTERRAYLPLVSRGPVDVLESIDVIWYLRNKATFLFEVEWTAMLGDVLLRRGPAIPNAEQLVRFLVVLPERVDLVRFKLERSPLIRAALERDNWHILKADHLRDLVGREAADLADLAPYLGLDAEIERSGEQLPLFR
jgi:hypothetical protein